MKRLFGQLAAAFSILALMLVAAGPVHAQAARTWVSGVGNDANPCSRTAPCQTFAGAIGQTATDGEINCLDAGGFGTVSITKSITIDCHDAFGAILNTGTVGINIRFDNFSGGDNRKIVRLRNLNLNGTDGGLGQNDTTGIRISGALAGTTVIIEDCLIEGQLGGTARGIDDNRSGAGKLIITNTTIRNSGGGGLSVLPSGSSNIQVLLNNFRAYNNGTGAQFGNLARVVIDQSTFDGNAGAGILTVSGAIADVDRSTFSHNANGVQALGGLITLSNSNIKLNTSQGVNVSGGIVNSFGNNRISNNASPGTTPILIGSTSNPTGQQ
jgi:hypothetical protein